MAKILSVLFLVVVGASSLFCDEANSHQERLAKLKSETAKKEHELKKYKEQEKKISKEIHDNYVTDSVSFIESELLKLGFVCSKRKK